MFFVDGNYENIQDMIFLRLIFILFSFIYSMQKLIWNSFLYSKLDTRDVFLNLHKTTAHMLFHNYNVYSNIN